MRGGEPHILEIAFKASLDMTCRSQSLQLWLRNACGPRRRHVLLPRSGYYMGIPGDEH